MRMFDPMELTKELQDMRDAGYLSDALLRHAVRRIKSSDPRFDWVGVYLVRDLAGEEEGQELWLHNYIGSPTEHARIPVGQGVCGLAVAEGRNINVPDVSKFENYLACNPDVMAEMVVLIRAGSQIFGQIDIDSESRAAFKDADEAALQVVADKLAEQLAAERR
jgi:L-methionine (R)-S-oxide reductase